MQDLQCLLLTETKYCLLVGRKAGGKSLYKTDSKPETSKTKPETAKTSEAASATEAPATAESPTSKSEDT
jgi:hypothetical protein